MLTNLAADDTTCIYNQWPTDLIVDTNGYTRPNSTFATVVPGRLLETRTGPGLATIDGDQNGIGARPAATITVVKIAGRAGIPAGASSAVLTVTATSAQAAGYLTVWPCDQPRPNASNLNYATGTTIANTVLTNLAADDTTCIYNQSPTDLIVDTNGYD